MKTRNMAGLGFLIGLIGGTVAWSSVQHAYRKDLFNRHPVRRFAALGHLAARPTVATAQLLREFIAWEQRPALRTRAKQMLRDVEQSLTP